MDGDMDEEMGDETAREARDDDQGEARTQYRLGLAKARGGGAPPDYASAATHFAQAARLGHAKSQYNLGILYLNGQGVAQDHGQAMKCFLAAAEQGELQAQFNLGLMHLRGQGAAVDFDLAADWFARAAGRGFARAQHNLGLMYFHGLGLERSLVRAHLWLGLAAANADDEQQARNSASARAEVEGLMTPQEVSQAMALAAEFMSGRSGRGRAVSGKSGQPG